MTAYSTIKVQKPIKRWKQPRKCFATYPGYQTLEGKTDEKRHGRWRLHWHKNTDI